MVQKNDSSFSFNSWRVEDSESNIMDMYRNQIVDLIDKIETFKDGALIHTKALTLKNTNLWRLSRLVKNYGVTIVESNDSNKIYFLSNYDDNDFAFAFEELKKENTTKYGEFVSSYFAWIGLNRQKNRADELNEMTRKNKYTSNKY